MTDPTPRRTPAGTWPVVVAGLLLLAFTPLAFAVPAFPRPLAIAVVAVFVIGSVWALAASVVILWRAWGTRARGVPIIGCVLGVILVPVVFVLMLPAALG